MPYFIITGSFKCGTTSMYKYLSKHPQVQLLADSRNSVRTKETRMLANLKVPVPTPLLLRYLAHFPVLHADDAAHSVTGEASPNYITEPTSPSIIRDVVPHARLIHMLREPVDRAASQVKHALGLVPNANSKDSHDAVQALRDTARSELAVLRRCLDALGVSFLRPACDRYAKLLECVRKREKNSKHFAGVLGSMPDLLIVTRGLYWLSLCHFRSVHPDARTLVVIAEDLFSNAVAEMTRVTAFLRLQPVDWSSIVSVKYNVARAAVEGKPSGAQLDLLPQPAGITRHSDVQRELVCELHAFFEPWNRLLRQALRRPDLWLDASRERGVLCGQAEGG